MSQEMKKNSLKEHLEQIKYRVNYNISETPRYKPVIEDDMEFDEIPSNTYATQDGFPMPNVGGSDAYIE